ncbi:unnamed protein product [Cutaneotrichosporon oleaginosum]
MAHRFMPPYRGKTPPGAHHRVYEGSIRPTADELGLDAYYPIATAPLALLEPLDLATYPTTSGPMDKEPACLLREEARKVDHDFFLTSLTTTPESQAMLKAALAESRRAECIPFPERLGSVPKPPWDYRKVELGLMTARSMRELQKLKERLTPPSSIKELFLPTSQHYMGGTLPVPLVTTEPASSLDGINAALKLGDLGPAVKDLLHSVAQPVPANPLDRVWARWDELDKNVAKWHSCRVAPPILPMRAKGQFDVTLNDKSKLVAMPTSISADEDVEKLDGTASWNAYEGAEDIDPYSPIVSDEFNKIVPKDISATTRASSEPSRCYKRRRFASLHLTPSPLLDLNTVRRHPDAKCLVSGGTMSDKSLSCAKSNLEPTPPNSLCSDSNKSPVVTEASGMHGGGDAIVSPRPQSNVTQQDAYDGHTHLVQHAQPWASPSTVDLDWSSLLSSAVPLGHDFARYGLDWAAPLQTTDEPDRLLSPIHLRKLPALSPSNVSDPEPELPRSDWMGPSKYLTYGDSTRPASQRT